MNDYLELERIKEDIANMELEYIEILENRCAKLKKENDFLNERRLYHKEQNKRYREALEFYANENNYEVPARVYFASDKLPEKEIMKDKGAVARKALEE